MSRWYPCIYCTEDLHCTKYTDDNFESWCLLGPCAVETPSHGDQIRRMSDEELAEWLEKISPHTEWTFYLQGGTWLDWLKEGVDE